MRFASNGMTVFVFGNPDLQEDSLPLRLLPRLRNAFPAVRFEAKDPNEEWEAPEQLIAIDTVVGIDHVQVFHDLGHFDRSPRISMHDFDALTQLRLLAKLGKLKTVNIIGVPSSLDEHHAFLDIVRTLSDLIHHRGTGR